MTVKAIAAAGLATAALLGSAAAGAETYYYVPHGSAYTVTTRPYTSDRVYVYEYAYPRDTVAYYDPYVSRRMYMEDAGRRWDAMTQYGRDLTPYEADRYFGHPRYPSNYYSWEGRWDPWSNRSLASTRDSNPTDYATGIYNPRK
jgi:hypothetical protein